MRRLGGAIGVAVLMLFVWAPPALANDQSWTAVNGGGQTVATARFDDAANRVYITDTRTDGSRGSVASRIDIWRVGNIDGTHVKCPVGSLGSTNCPLIWVEDTHLKGQLCQYPSSTEEYCSPIKEFYS